MLTGSPKPHFFRFCFFTPPTGSPLFFLCRVASCFFLLLSHPKSQQDRTQSLISLSRRCFMLLLAVVTPQITAGSHSITHFSIENHFTHHSSRARTLIRE
uniref:(northern house mosquito) hypothetical protein n=1 Tax=Culex pipiens TaxID=7175 RepID=A0A8D8A7S2_CULPI